MPVHALLGWRVRAAVTASGLRSRPAGWGHGLRAGAGRAGSEVGRAGYPPSSRYVLACAPPPGRHRARRGGRPSQPPPRWPRARPARCAPGRGGAEGRAAARRGGRLGVGGEAGGGVGASGRERAGEAGGEKQMVAAGGGGRPNPNPNPNPDLDELRRQPATCHGGRHHGRLAHEAEARAPGRASVGEYTRALAIPLPVLGRGGREGRAGRAQGETPLPWHAHTQRAWGRRG